METGDKKRILLCVMAAVLLLGGGLFAWHFLKSPETAGETSDVVVIGEEASPRTGRRLLIYITGAVKNPGVYELPAGSRLFDAVKAAGDVIPYADLEAVNMSAPLKDAEKIHIPLAPDKTDPTAEGKININTATEKELTDIPGVGAATAAKIIAYRNEHGAFKTREEIKKVPTIGEGKYKQMEDKITL